jgi:hypothetical protein
MSDSFFIGANLPWLRYGGDFGANKWSPAGGLSRRSDAGAIVEHLAALGSQGVTVVRWFVLCDGRAGVVFGPDGTPVGLDDEMARDLDTALDWLERAGLRMMPVLLDFLWCRRAKVTGGVQLGGHRRVLATGSGRRALVDGVVGPLLERYGHEPRIYAWDVINEPEWVTLGPGTWNPWASVPRSAMRAFIAEVTARVHEVAVQPVTVGSACARWLDLVMGLGLDFYQPHWYDRFEADLPLATPVAALGADRPVVLGEFPTKGSAYSPDLVLANARAAGYQGALFWSVNADDGATDFPGARLAVERWARATTAPGSGTDTA